MRFFLVKLTQMETTFSDGEQHDRMNACTLWLTCTDNDMANANVKGANLLMFSVCCY